MYTPDPIAFTIFGLEIRWYGILITLGAILAVFISYKRAPRYDINPDDILDLTIFTLPIGIIGARLYYVLFNWDYYSGNISSILNIRAGGLAIHGGLIFGLVTVYIVCKYKNINCVDVLDLVFPSIALAQSIGRWGNYFNSEAYGSPTDLPWAIYVDGDWVHPTFLYESIWCLIIFILLSILFKRGRKFKGQVALLYGILYSFERFFVEALRTDSLMIGPFKQAQVISVIAFIACLSTYIYLYNKKRKEQL